MTLRGIDLSNNNGFIGLHPESIDFAIFKATGGNQFVDYTCNDYVEAAKSKGLLWGFYHFAKDGYHSTSGKAEAEFFIKHCKNYFGKGIPVLDLEDVTLPDWQTYTHEFVRVVYEETGVYPIIYTGLEGLNRLKYDPYIVGNCAFWFAGYPLPYFDDYPSLELNCYYTTPKECNIVMWQFTDRLPYYGSLVDGNVAYMTKAQWAQYANGGKKMADNITPKDVWAYKNKALESGDAYQILRDIRDNTSQILKEVAALSVAVSELKLTK